MRDLDSGWTWFDEAREEVEGGERPAEITADLLKAYVRTFHSEYGCRVMRHLRAITTGRALGPDASDALLRHLEGQRQLVNYISILAERGSNQIGSFYLTTNKSNQRRMEIKND